MEKNLWFDMDGTFVDLYGVENWLPMLINEDSTPYKVAKPLLNLKVFARKLNQKIKQGYSVNVVSWTSKNSSKDYAEKIKVEKLNWLRKHLKSVKFTNIDIIDYGTPKQNNRNGILFDDEKQNRDNWNGLAFNVENIIGTLNTLN